MNMEFNASENFIEDEVRRFYDWIGMEIESLPDITIDVTSETINGGHFNPEKDETKLFPEFEHSDHRLAEGNLSDLSFRDKLSTKYGVHEAAHSYFRKKFDLPEIDYVFESSVDLITAENLHKWLYDMEDNEVEDIFQHHEESFSINPEFSRDLIVRQAEKVRSEFGEESYSDFIRFAGLRGINETLARIMAEKYVCNDIKQIDSSDVYSNMRGTPYSVKVADVEGVRISKLGQRVESEGFQSVLDMSEEQLLENYYEPKNELTFS